MAQAICDTLCVLDPQHQETYHRNLREFLKQLDQKIAEWRAKLVPCEGREVVGYHREFTYLMNFAGVTASYVWDLPTGATVVCAFGVSLVACTLFRHLMRA